jgi:hypothetical protein
MLINLGTLKILIYIKIMTNVMIFKILWHKIGFTHNILLDCAKNCTASVYTKNLDQFCRLKLAKIAENGEHMKL